MMEESESMSQNLSPSLALLERLQKLRRWQQEQREALMRSHSGISLDGSDHLPSPTLPPSLSLGSGVPTISHSQEPRNEGSELRTISHSQEPDIEGSELRTISHSQEPRNEGSELRTISHSKEPRNEGSGLRTISHFQEPDNEGSGQLFDNRNAMLPKPFQLHKEHGKTLEGEGEQQDGDYADILSYERDYVPPFHDTASTHQRESVIITEKEETRNKEMQQIYKIPLVKPTLVASKETGIHCSPGGDTNGSEQQNSFDFTHDNFSFKPKREILQKKHGISTTGKNVPEEKKQRIPYSALRVETQDISPDTTHSKPRFQFLKKGQGTSRFRMRQPRLKRFANQSALLSLEAKEFDEMLSNEVRASQPVSPPRRIPLKTFPNRIGNRPISKLALTPISKGSNAPVESLRPRSTIHTKEPEVSGARKLPVHRIAGTHLSSESSEDEKRRRTDKEELSAFEKLEELADDSSFSSNSSTVWQLLRKGQRSVSSTPVRSPPPLSVQETPIHYVQKQGASRNLLETLVAAGETILEESSEDTGYTHTSNENSVEQIQEKQQNLISLSQVLEQLRAIVRLEETENVNISQEDVQTLLESLVQPGHPSPVGTLVHFAQGLRQNISNSTSTPAYSQINPHTLFNLQLGPQTPGPRTSGPRVHFQQKGVEVREYEPSDTEGEDTLTDATSIVEDDTDLVAISDLEALTRYNVCKTSGARLHPIDSGKQDDEEESDRSTMVSEDSDQFHPPLSTPMHQVQPMVLQFSPPPQKPAQCASNYIWSIFGKDKNAQKMVHNEKNRKGYQDVKSGTPRSMDNLPTTCQSDNRNPPPYNMQNTEDHINQEIESHKTLLLAKICELEKETEAFTKENTKLKNLQKTMEKGIQQIAEERGQLQANMEKEKIQFQQYVDKERNSLWKEKQEFHRKGRSVTTVQEQSLEIVYLKEQLHDMQEESKKKESLHQFHAKKFQDRIKMLEQENKQLKGKNASLQVLEKENLDLRHKLDRTKLSKKPALKDTQNKNQIEKPKMKKITATIDNINKSLSRKTSSELLQKKLVSQVSEVSAKPNYSQQQTQDSNYQLHTQDSNYDNNDNDYPTRDDEGIVELGENYTKEKSIDTDRVLYNQQFSLPKNDEVLVTDNDPSGGKNSLDFTENLQSDGTKEIIYANGNKKLIHRNGTVVLSYYNGDKKEVHSDKIVYIYGKDQTSHTTFNDGHEILEFPNGQKETRFPDGSSQIIFADNTKKTTSCDGTETCILKDGTIVSTSSDGVKVFEFPSGQREVHTSQEKRREYPDGTVKILLLDGRTETHYKTGRVRIKDREGKVLSDTHQGVQ